MSNHGLRINRMDSREEDRKEYRQRNNKFKIEWNSWEGKQILSHTI